MKAHQLCWISILAGMGLLSACGGVTSGTGSNASSSTTRTLTGNVDTASSTPAALTKSATTASASTCGADTVMATSTDSSTTSATVADDCSFTLTLDVDKTYSLAFVKDGAFVASLLFNSGSTFSSSSIHLAAGTDAVDLGKVSFDGSVASSAINPLDQIDSDGDGLADSVDPDDNNDGILDVNEPDCDLNGIPDYLDTQSTCTDNSSTSSTDSAQVLEVKPRNRPADDTRPSHVGLDKDVRAHISCIVDETSLTAETFSVVDANGTAVDCTYAMHEHEDDSGIKCSHDTEFLPDTVYTATIKGVLCDDGTTVQTRTWSWKTETADAYTAEEANLTGGSGTNSSHNHEDQLDDTCMMNNGGNQGNPSGQNSGSGPQGPSSSSNQSQRGPSSGNQGTQSSGQSGSRPQSR